jgi:hypothetical protein
MGENGHGNDRRRPCRRHSGPARETGLAGFPADCAFSFDELIDPAFWPEGRKTP